MAALETDLLGKLRGEGITDLQCFAITAPGVRWEDRVPGYDTATFPVMIDSTGAVYYVYGANAYDVFLVDRQGRLVSRYQNFDSSMTNTVKQRLRELAAE